MLLVLLVRLIELIARRSRVHQLFHDNSISCSPANAYNLFQCDAMANTQPSDSFDALEHVQKFWSGMRDRSPIYRLLLADVEILSASKAGSVTARLNVTAAHLNSKNSLHGTVSACIVDWAGGLAIASTGLDKTGVSTDIHTSFVSGAKEGDVLEIFAQASKVGGSLAFTSVDIKKIGKDGSKSVVTTGSHTKYVKQ